MDLNRYDRATLALWARGHAEIADHQQQSYLASVAIQAVLAGLRRWAQYESLFVGYERDPATDFDLIGSLVDLAHDPQSQLHWWIRDAAYFLRWQELVGKNT